MTKPRAKPHYWSEEEINYLKEITPGRYTKEITQLMNEKFEYQFTESQIREAMKRYKIHSGIDTRFQAGYTPLNKGTKGVLKANGGSYKAGHTPLNKRPIGSERKTADGYTEIKVGEPGRWELKHRVLYEQYHNVKLGKEQIVIFLNRDKTDFSKENLVVIDRKTQIYLNKEGLMTDDKEINRTSIKIAELYKTIYEKQGGTK